MGGNDFTSLIATHHVKVYIGVGEQFPSIMGEFFIKSDCIQGEGVFSSAKTVSNASFDEEMDDKEKIQLGIFLFSLVQSC